MARYTNGHAYSNDRSDLDAAEENLERLQNTVRAMQADFTQQLARLNEEIASVASTVQRLREDATRKTREGVNRIATIDGENRVYLDVGGDHFTTAVQTLTQNGSSTFFMALIEKEWDRKTNSAENRLFIDRDGTLFNGILKYLRTGQLIIDEKINKQQLLTEAKYYDFKKLVNELEPILKEGKSSSLNEMPRSRSSSPLSSSSQTNPDSRSSSRGRPGIWKSTIHPSHISTSWRTKEQSLNVFTESRLLTSTYEEKLLEFLANQNETSNQTWILIYRASEHGFDANDFHDHCDNFYPTISIIQSESGDIFGGFTSIPATSSKTRSDRSDPTAFLFTLKNHVRVPPTKFPVAEQHQQSAISENPTCGPNFGSPKNGGSDLCLFKNFREKSNFSHFPKSYVDTTSYGNALFGGRYFACKEVEVFRRV